MTHGEPMSDYPAALAAAEDALIRARREAVRQGESHRVGRAIS